MPEYRAGSYTTSPGPDVAPWGKESTGVQLVTFSSPRPDANYRIISTNADTSPILMSGVPCGGSCLLTIDSRSTTGFTFSYRSDLGTGGIDFETHTIYPIRNYHKFDYIAIADN